MLKKPLNHFINFFFENEGFARILIENKNNMKNKDA